MIPGNNSEIWHLKTVSFSNIVHFGWSICLVIYQKGFILKRVAKKRKKVMSGSTDVLFVVYIRTSHLTKYSSIYFQEFTTMSKINHMKKVIEYMNVLRKDFRVRQEVIDRIQKVFLFLKMSFKLPLKIIHLVKKERKNHFCWMGMD